MSEPSLDMMYLSTKRSLLSNPGIKMDDIYYGPFNTTVEMSEVTYNLGRLTIGLSQLNFGSQSQLIIPNNSLLSTCYLHLELPAIIANQTICRGWGYAAINNINFLFGSSNVSQIQLSGQSLFQTIMMEAETAEKRSELFRGWGYAAINNINFLFGSSNVSQIQLSGQSLFQTIMMEAETAEKRSELF